MTAKCSSNVYCSCYTNRTCRLVILTIIVIPIVINFVVQMNWPVFHVFINRDINSPCVLPKLDFYDASIANFFWKSDPVKCEPWNSLMLIDSEGMLRFNTSAIDSAGYNNLQCTYKKVVRVGDYNVTFTEETEFKDPIYIKNDLIYVQCKHNNKLVYDNLHFNIDYKSVLEKKTLQNESQDHLSIYMFGFDSLSHLIAERKMPLTMRYLRDELGAYVLNGYTKVGDNTQPNLMGLFAGRRTGEIKYNLETLPFIWKHFSSQLGYVDMYTEDWPSIAAFQGFKDPPAQHYFRPFFLAAQKIRTQSIRNVKRLLLFLEHHNFRLKDVSYLCFGNTPNHQLALEYYKKFISAYGNKRKFGVSFLNEIGHDFINFFDYVDKDMVSLFKWMKESNKLDNAVLMLYADHGPRYSEIQNTGIGRVTSMMPVMSIYIPEHIRTRFPHIHKNFKINSERLTTPFDVHEMLMDISKQNFEPQKPIDLTQKIPRGISLFREIPKTRSCHQADIPEHYCPCYSSDQLNVSDTLVQKVSQHVVDRINYILKDDFRRCAKLSLSSIKSAYLVKSNFVRDTSVEEFSLRTFVYSSGEDKRILIALETIPSKGVFESTVQVKGESNMKILGDINRVNKYGNQSHCISDLHDPLKMYCLCI